jgi:hypothetical protein
MSWDNSEISPICPSKVKISHTFPPIFFTVIYLRLSHFDSAPINDYAWDMRQTSYVFYILYESPNATFSNDIGCEYVALLLLKNCKLKWIFEDKHYGFFPHSMIVSCSYADYVWLFLFLKSMIFIKNVQKKMLFEDHKFNKTAVVGNFRYETCYMLLNAFYVAKSKLTY